MILKFDSFEEYTEMFKTLSHNNDGNAIKFKSSSSQVLRVIELIEFLT